MTVRQGAAYITANGHYYYTVGKVLNLGGHMYVPIRPMARSFNTEVSWNAEGRYVELSTENRKTKTVARANYDADSVYWLSRIISAEAGGEPFLGQIAVGNVVMNRVASTEFPNTIPGVIFDRVDAVQFEPVKNGTIYKTPTPQSIEAAKRVLDGENVIDGAMYFYAPALSQGIWINANRTYYKTIGCHRFYL
jgi:N-acetylmuramoyl-L-alanine amidase